MSKILLSIEQVRFIWSLGFMSGRVQESCHPKSGVTWDEETPQWENDLTRLASGKRNPFGRLAEKVGKNETITKKHKAHYQKTARDN